MKSVYLSHLFSNIQSGLEYADLIEIYIGLISKCLLNLFNNSSLVFP